MNDATTGWRCLEVPFVHGSEVSVRPGPEAGAPLIVLCHGMGETPKRTLPHFPRTAALPVHLVAPRGPFPFEVRGSDSIRIGGAWYLYDGRTDWWERTLEQSSNWVAKVIAEVEDDEKWRPRNRVLIGYSQGAYFGYMAALSRQDLFSHLVAVAGRLKTEFVAPALADPQGLRSLILHGAEDASVSPESAHLSHRALTRAGYHAEVAVLPGDHRLGPHIDDKIASWLSAELNLDGTDS